MKKNRQNYWYNYTRKSPIGFSNIKGKQFYYKYYCDLVIIQENDIYNEGIEIEVKMDKDRNIDFEETKKILLKDYNLTDVSFNTSNFKRDGALFEFITCIRSYSNLDSYFHFKKMKNRKLKLFKLKNC